LIYNYVFTALIAMDLKRLRTFVTVAECGTISRASTRLRITQPALSRQISSLQRELDLQLFDRVGRNIVLTAEGEQFLSECRELLDRADGLKSHAALIRKGDRGTLKVAAASVGIETAFAELLHAYAKIFPSVQIKLHEANGAQVVDMLSRREIHFGICLLRSLNGANLNFTNMQLQPVQMLAVCHPSYSL
jgi:DNA-binding transcriptional LysR family regulator